MEVNRRNTTLALDANDLKNKEKLDKTMGIKNSYIGIFRVGLKYLLKLKGQK